MLNSTILLKVASWVAIVLGVIDLIRGTVHTFFIREIAVVASGIEAHPDALVLMSAFGMSNFLTGFLLILIALKARHLVPLVLLLIPSAYLLGSFGMRLSEVTLESAFNGQYMMRIYLAVSLLTAVLCFVSRSLENRIRPPNPHKMI